MDDTVTHVVLAGAAPPSFDVLKFTASFERIRAVTVVNQTQLTVSLFPRSFNPQGAPAFTVGPMQQVTLPVPDCQSVAVSYNGNSAVNGFIYIHYANEYLAPNNSAIQTSRDGVLWTLSGKVAYATPGVETLVPTAVIVGQTPQINGGGALPNISSLLSLAHVSLYASQPMGDATNPWHLYAFNSSKSGALSAFNGFQCTETSIDLDFASPLPLYNVTAQDSIGDIIDIALQFTLVNAGTLVYNLELLLQ